MTGEDRLPSDDEYLTYLYDVLKDDSYIADVRRAGHEEATSQSFSELAASGVFKSDEEKLYQTLSQEMSSPEIWFRGRFIQTLRTSALATLGTDGPRAEPIPIGLLPTGELNACAIATPRGGAVILLDHGVIPKLMYVCRCALAFISWRSDTPFCRDASQDAYAEALIALARSCTTGDLRELAPHQETLRFPSLSDYDRTTVTFCRLMEVFILVHEYGHALLGHLSADNLRPAFAGRVPTVREFNKSQLQEFEADAYAVDQLLKAGSQDGLRPSDVAWCVGLVLKFFELCETVSRPPGVPTERTHPPAHDRWDRVKAKAGLAAAGDAFAHNLDPAFALLIRGSRK